MLKIAVLCFATLTVLTSSALAQTRGLPNPNPLPPPTLYSAPTPAPMAPPVNPGSPAVPPSGLSPLLTQPAGPGAAGADQALPSYPATPLPGPTGEQNMQAYRNSLLQQQWQLDRSGAGQYSERSREIQQQLNQTGSQP